MIKQQTTPQEYQLQDKFAKNLASRCANQLISDLEKWSANKRLIHDDHGFPYSGDHLGKFRYEY